MRSPLHSLTLMRAAEILGGKVPLRDILRVPMSDLERWLAGIDTPPADVFLKAVDVISAPLDHANARAEALASRTKLTAEAMLDLAISASGADMGNVQLVFPDGLRIVAQRGFEQPFLDFFAVVDERSAATCGEAKKTGRRVVVADVASSPIFAGTAAAEVMARAGVRAVQSTPLIGAGGELVGMLNTHFTSAGEPAEADLQKLDRIAAQAVLALAAA